MSKEKQAKKNKAEKEEEEEEIVSDTMEDNDSSSINNNKEGLSKRAGKGKKDEKEASTEKHQEVKGEQKEVKGEKKIRKREVKKGPEGVGICFRILVILLISVVTYFAWAFFNEVLPPLSISSSLMFSYSLSSLIYSVTTVISSPLIPHITESYFSL